MRLSGKLGIIITEGGLSRRREGGVGQWRTRCCWRRRGKQEGGGEEVCVRGGQSVAVPLPPSGVSHQGWGEPSGVSHTSVCPCAASELAPLLGLGLPGQQTLPAWATCRAVAVLPAAVPWHRGSEWGGAARHSVGRPHVGSLRWVAGTGCQSPASETAGTLSPAAWAPACLPGRTSGRTLRHHSAPPPSVDNAVTDILAASHRNRAPPKALHP